MRVVNQLDFGGPWLALQLIRTLKLDTFFELIMPLGYEVFEGNRNDVKT